MMPKVKKPEPPPHPVSAADMKTFNTSDETSRAYSSLISTGNIGLTRKADTVKRTLLGGSA